MRQAGWQNCAGLQVTSTRHPHAKSPEYGLLAFFWDNRLLDTSGLKGRLSDGARSHVSAELNLSVGCPVTSTIVSDGLS